MLAPDGRFSHHLVKFQADSVVCFPPSPYLLRVVVVPAQCVLYLLLRPNDGFSREQGARAASALRKPAMGDAARRVWGTKGREMMKSKRVLRTVDAQPAGGAGLRAYPAVFRARASGAERTLNLARTQSLEEIKKAVCAAFNGWYDCELIDLDSGGAIALDAEFTRIVLDFESREVVRKEDALEAKLQEARSLVLSTRTDLQYHGCHALWELACRPDNHRSGLGVGLNSNQKNLPFTLPRQPQARLPSLRVNL